MGRFVLGPAVREACSTSLFAEQTFCRAASCRTSRRARHCCHSQATFVPSELFMAFVVRGVVHRCKPQKGECHSLCSASRCLSVFGIYFGPVLLFEKRLLDFGCTRSDIFYRFGSILFNSRLGSLSFAAAALEKRRRRDRVFDRFFVNPTFAKGLRA